MNKLKDYKNIHFIGIGGVSMRSLAAFASKYSSVSGSDCRYTETLDALKAAGIDAYAGHNLRKVADSGLVVYTAAIPSDDAELACARDFGIPTMERREFLKLVADCCQKTLAVAGSHGKTTVTAMLAHIFNRAGKRFTAHVGGDAADIGGGFTDKGDEWFVTEACEYNRSFLSLSPAIGVITNVGFDHPDCYSDYDDIKDAFARFNARSAVCVVPEGEFGGKNVVTFGLESGDFQARKLREKGGKYSFEILKNGNFFCGVSLSVAGIHNVANALAAAAAADAAGIDAETVGTSLGCFNGVKRRFECKGKTAKGARVISDYAHHPDEIAGAIDTARRQTTGKIAVIFEPHTYSRTEKLFSGFLECFYWADEIILLPTFAAREKPSDGVDTAELYAGLRKNNLMPYFAKNYEEAAAYADFAAGEGDIILVTGAGTVDGVCDLLV